MEVGSQVGVEPNLQCNVFSRSEHELELAKQNDEGEVMDAIFPNWRLNSSSVSITDGVLPSLGHCLPWMYIRYPRPVGHSRSGSANFANIETKQTFLVGGNDLLGTNPLYSKGGWLLVRSRDRKTRIVVSHGRSLPTINYFLVNATSGARLELPSMLATSFPRAAFTLTSDGVPDRVLYAHLHNMNELIVFLARPGDSKWIERTAYCGRQTGLVEGLVISGGMAYFFLSSHTYVLGLDDYEWKERFQFGSNCARASMLECEGKIVLICSAIGNLGPGPFYRVERTEEHKLKMVEMSDDELEGRVWFLNGLQQSFCMRVKGKGRKVCCFRKLRFIGGFAFTACCYDVVRGTCARFTSDSDVVPSQRGSWVDLCTCGSPNHADLSHLGITYDDLFPGFEEAARPLDCLPWDF